MIRAIGGRSQPQDPNPKREAESFYHSGGDPSLGARLRSVRPDMDFANGPDHSGPNPFAKQIEFLLWHVPDYPFEWRLHIFEQPGPFVGLPISYALMVFEQKHAFPSPSPASPLESEYDREWRPLRHRFPFPSVPSIR